MPDSIIDSFVLQPDEPDKDEDKETKDETDVKVDNSPSELEALKAELAAERALNKTAIADLRRSVGRVQSFAEKSAKDGASADSVLQDAVKAGFGSVSDLLTAIVSSADESVFTPELRAKVAEAAAAARQRTEADSLKKELDAKIAAAIAAAKPATDETRSAGAALETEIVKEIRSYGLDDSDFDWEPAAQLFAQGDADGVRNYFRTQIKTHLGNQSADERRQSKKNEQRQSPEPDSAGKNTDAAIIGDTKRTFAERKAALDRMLG